MSSSTSHKMRLYFVTWNVATKYPEQDPNQMLGINHNDTKNMPDFYIVGLQEVKSQPQNILIDFLTEDPWTKIFKETLKKYDYVKIRTQRLQGLVLNVFCVRKHLVHLRMIEARYTRTGLGGMWGNKGAVSLRLNLYGVSLCILNTHLTPHDHLLADRISDYNTILREHSFQVPETRHILYHDYIFWIGDLNFRLNGQDLSAEMIDDLIKKKDLNKLLNRDQLRLVMEHGDAFAELIEGKITFPPTYKFEFASQDYDLKRRPSWTDRILFKVNADVYEDTKLEAIQKNYKSHPSYVQSDHKPVTAEFEITIRPDFEKHDGIIFQTIPEWFIDEQNSACYSFFSNFKSSNVDWIGLYQDGFSSLDEYIVYEYVNRTNRTNNNETSDPRLLTEKIYFSESVLKSAGMYRLIYVAQQGDIVSILGISPPFPGHRRIQ